MKKVFLQVLIILVISSINTFSQWNTIWTSLDIPDSKASGWLNFEKTNKGWKDRMYTIDSLSFQIMQSGYSNTPEFVYNFSDAERLAGVEFYSLKQDLTGDNITEFYVLSYLQNGRQAMKIINIVNNSTVFERNQMGYSFSEPTIVDLDDDKTLECVVLKWEFPYQNKYYHEVYNTGVATGDIKSSSAPVRFELKQNYPNPFNPETTIDFSIDIPQQITIKIFDLKGELIKNITDEYKSSGSYSVKWDGTNLNNNKMPSGIYFYRIEGMNVTSTKKMILLK